VHAVFSGSSSISAASFGTLGRSRSATWRHCLLAASASSCTKAVPMKGGNDTPSLAPSLLPPLPPPFVTALSLILDIGTPLLLGRTLASTFFAVVRFAAAQRAGLGACLAAFRAFFAYHDLFVNLACRLEQAAPPGEILISYETYALVKDEVSCEEQAHINVKGISHAVATYQVIDLYDDLGKNRDLIHEESPRLKLDVDLKAISTKERSEAVTVLQRAVDRLSRAGESADPTIPVKEDRA
jgi:hypothetical protein